MHGGKSKSGSSHPNFRHGRFTKCLRGLGYLLKPRPVNVEVLLFPLSLEEIAKRLGRERLRAMIVQPGQVTVAEWMRALRAARRVLAQELAELRAEADDGP
jgi:hypothetical protein